MLTGIRLRMNWQEDEKVIMHESCQTIACVIFRVKKQEQKRNPKKTRIGKRFGKKNKNKEKSNRSRRDLT